MSWQIRNHGKNLVNLYHPIPQNMEYVDHNNEVNEALSKGWFVIVKNSAASEIYQIETNQALLKAGETANLLFPTLLPYKYTMFIDNAADIALCLFYKNGTYVTTLQTTTTNKITFDLQELYSNYSPDVYTYAVIFLPGNDWIEFSLIEDESPKNYKPRSDYLEYDVELYGFGGIYDEMTLSGFVIKKWKKASSLAVNSVDASLTNTYKITTELPESNFDSTATHILIKADKIPLQRKNNDNDEEHYYTDASGIYIFISKATIDSESGTNINEKVQNYVNQMTFIYKLNKSEYIQTPINGNGVYIERGYNYLVLPENALTTLELMDSPQAINTAIG